MRKQVRINPAGMIVNSDRMVHVTTDDGTGAADEVEWMYTGNPRREHTIDFNPYLKGSPFEGPNATTFPVPIGGSAIRRVARSAEGTYKYDVVESGSGKVTDDPDVIVD